MTAPMEYASTVPKGPAWWIVLPVERNSPVPMTPPKLIIMR